LLFVALSESFRCVSAGRSFAAAAGPSQFPSFVIAIGTTSYFVLSIASMTERAERTDTSCSPDRPPKITPMRSFVAIFRIIGHEDTKSQRNDETKR
jgi:hypothetical protein